MNPVLPTAKIVLGRARRRFVPAAALAIAAALLASLGVLSNTATAAVKPRASLPQIERQVMCVTCKIPLMVAESPQANRERVFIQSLIDKGEDESQIKAALVGQYGASVLGLPADHGFDATVYLVPLAFVLVLAATLLVLLPRWRRRARAQAAASAPAVPLAPADAARLDSDLARFD
jgi:cytochrome c-type biogenesis protein CcmH